MKKANIFKYLLGVILFSHALSALAEESAIEQTSTSTSNSNIINNCPVQSMIMSNIQDSSPFYKNLILQNGFNTSAINSQLDELKKFAIQESKETEKIEEAVKNTNKGTCSIGPSAITPQKSITLDDMDDFDDSENSNIKVKILSKDKPSI